jgi:hypothetical protein
VERDSTAIVNRAPEHVATIGFNEPCRFWQIVIELREPEPEFFCPRRELGFARSCLSIRFVTYQASENPIGWRISNAADLE